MRLAITAVIVCLGMPIYAVQPAVSQSASPSAPASDASGLGQSDAAEKHAKRTACLKDAKSKKLVGAQKTAYVKSCMAANLPPDSPTSPASPSGPVPAPE
jgi:hypothetical protein